MILGIVRQAFRLYTVGDPDTRIATTGVALLLAGLTEAATSTLAALVALFWLCDMVSGAMRAVSIGGIHAFLLRKFAEGFAKATAGAIGICIGVGLDTKLSEIGVHNDYFSTTAMTLVAFGFASSAIKNVAHWWPALAALLKKALGVVFPNQEPKEKS